VDEAGRGPLAGPVVTAAVILSENTEELIGVNDSKQISKWIDHFKNIDFKVPVTGKLGAYYQNDDRKENMNNIPDKIYADYNIIYEILLLGEGKISLCGGSLVDLINHGYNKSDWDLFFHCETVDEADNLLNKCLLLIENNKLNGLTDILVHYKNQRVHTVEYNGIIIQFIKRVYKSKDQVLLGFDLAPSRIGYNPFDGVYTTICGGLSIAMTHFPLDTTQRSMSFGYRLSKYINKGFNIMYPGIPLNLNDTIETPDGKLMCYDNILRFMTKKCFESDYDGDNGDHMN